MLCYRYVENRVFPAFRELYKGKRLVLVLDNASYHRALADDSMKATGSKQEMLAQLKRAGVQTITTHRVGKTFAQDGRRHSRDYKRGSLDQSQWEAKAPQGPFVQEVKEALKAYIAENPEVAKSAVEKLFERESLKDSNGFNKNFHRIIYTPPYLPQVQPGGQTWRSSGEVKGDVWREWASDYPLRRLRLRV